jgi:hypothetical protein
MKTWAILVVVSSIAVASCASPATSNPVPTTPTPRPRPLSVYDLGIWHSQIATEITHTASTILENFGHSGIDFEIEIRSATSLQDELIILKHASWPEDAD